MADESEFEVFCCGSWEIKATKSHISTAEELEEIQNSLQIHLPEMVFGRNSLQFKHSSGWLLEFNATDALSCCLQGPNFSPSNPRHELCSQVLQCAVAEEWKKRYDIFNILLYKTREEFI